MKIPCKLRGVKCHYGRGGWKESLGPKMVLDLKYNAKTPKYFLLFSEKIARNNDFVDL